MSHNSPRSQRVKQEARTRADVIWHDNDGIHKQKIEPANTADVLSGGSNLSQLITQSDAIMSKMRKIVQ